MPVFASLDGVSMRPTSHSNVVNFKVLVLRGEAKPKRARNVTRYFLRQLVVPNSKFFPILSIFAGKPGKVVEPCGGELAAVCKGLSVTKSG